MASPVIEDRATTSSTTTVVPPRAAGGRRKIVLPIVALLLLGALVWAFTRWSYGRAHESTDNAQVDGHIIPVLAKVGGYVSEVRVSENQPVTAGSVLARIDAAEFKVRLAQAEAELQAAVATAGGRGVTGQAEAGIATATSQRAVTAAQIQAAQANLERARSDFARYQDLAAKQIVSQQQLDAARTNVQAQEASLVALQRQQSAAGATITGAEAGQRLAEARLAAARSARDNAALQLSYTELTAPVSGQISRKTVEVGQLVQPGQTLLSIVADTGVWVTANFKETQLNEIRVGQPVELEVDAYKGCTAEGVVASVSAATGAKFALLPPDNATGNFTKVVQRVPVRVNVRKGCGPDRPLRPGMSVVAHVKTG